MDNLLRNPEYRRILIKIMLAQIIFILILFLTLNIGFKYLNTGLIEQNAALVGKLIEVYPNHEEEIVNIILDEASVADVEKGKAILSQYSYGSHMDIMLQPLLGSLYPKIKVLILSISLLFLIPLIFVVHREYSLIYEKIRHIAYVAERVVQDDFSHVLPKGDGGDFAILNHNFNQMANRIKLSLQALEDDKIFLKNTISDISHQLKTPLSSLIMFNELMLEDEQMDEFTRQKFLEKSKAQLERMEWLTINLLKMARLESGSIQFRKNYIPLVYPIHIALNSLNAKIVEKGLDVSILGDTKGTMVYGDEDWLGEAFINIIKNAIEHSDHGGKVDIYLNHTPIFSQVDIIDTGEGIDKKDLPHIFKRFYRSSSSVKTESVGIGLALAKIIIEEQNGTIWLESKKGWGTKFTITFLRGVI